MQIRDKGLTGKTAGVVFVRTMTVVTHGVDASLGIHGEQIFEQS